MNHAIAQTNSGEPLSKPVLPPATPYFAPFFRCSLAYVMFVGFCIGAPADELKSNPDFSNYEVPLYEQITNRIKARVSARLGNRRNKEDRYFIVPFAYEDRGNHPEFSHTFISVIRVRADNKQPKLTPGLQKRRYQNRDFEAFTVSWLPSDFAEDPHLCVFRGFGSRLIPAWNTCPTSVGRVFKLDETIRLGVAAQNAVCMWGPYEISEDAFDRAVKRLRLLEGGTIKYRADDRITRKDRSAINCFHATANLYELYPNGGLFGTGFKMWGVNGTTRVLIEYTKKSGNKGLLLEPVDVKADRFGFVYAPTRTSRGIYNPFQKASAYQR